MKRIDFQPVLFDTLKNYSKEKFFTDLMAGIIVGIVALPLAIAFGIASGVSPEQGLITAIIAGFIVSFLGGSNVQIGGPTGAFIVIVYGIIQQFGIEGLAIATVMAGIMLVLMGVFKLGTIIRFIPYPDRRRMYQWYCTYHFHDSDQRSVRINHGQSARRFYLQMDCLFPQFRHNELDCTRGRNRKYPAHYRHSPVF